MPCDSGMENYSYYSEYMSLKNELDRVSRLLCWVLQNNKNVIDFESSIKNDKDLTKWWEQHQKIDKERMERLEAEKKKQQLKKMALSKLTTEERKALGI